MPKQTNVHKILTFSFFSGKMTKDYYKKHKNLLIFTYKIVIIYIT